MTQEELEKTKARLSRHLQNLDEKYGNQTYGGRMGFITGYITARAGTGDERTYTETQLKEFFDLADRREETGNVKTRDFMVDRSSAI